MAIDCHELCGLHELSVRRVEHVMTSLMTSLITP